MTTTCVCETAIAELQLALLDQQSKTKLWRKKAQESHAKWTKLALVDPTELAKRVIELQQRNRDLYRKIDYCQSLLSPNQDLAVTVRDYGRLIERLEAKLGKRNRKISRLTKRVRSCTCQPPKREPLHD